MEQRSDTLTLIAGGDMGPVFEPVDRLADLVLPVLCEADFRLAQCERTYSERGFHQEWNMPADLRQHRRGIRVRNRIPVEFGHIDRCRFSDEQSPPGSLSDLAFDKLLTARPPADFECNPD